MLKNKNLCLILLIVLLLYGCVPTHEIEELGIIAARGVDSSEDNKVTTTLNIIRFDPQVDSIYTTVKGSGRTIKEAREDAGYHAGFDIFEGQVNFELYGKETAQKGISPYIGGLIRDARVSDTMKMAVSTSTAEDVFISDPEELQAVGQYLDTLVTVEVEEGNLPSSTLQDYTRKRTTIGQDAALPLIGFRENKPAIQGMAVFQDDRYVLDITLNEAYLLNLFLDQVKNTPIDFELPFQPFKNNIDKRRADRNLNEKETFTSHYISVRGSSKTNVTNLKELAFTTDVNLELDLVEINVPLSTKKAEVITKLEKELEREIKNQFDELLKKLQEVNADPFGFGKIYRANTKDGRLEEEEWREKYPDIQVEFKVDVKIMHTGTIN